MVKKAPIPKLSYPVRHLVERLSRHSCSPYYNFVRVGRGRNAHRPAWTAADTSKGTWELDDRYLRRALNAGVVEGSWLSGAPLPDTFAAVAEFQRIRLRVTPLGRAARAVAELLGTKPTLDAFGREAS